MRPIYMLAGIATLSIIAGFTDAPSAQAQQPRNAAGQNAQNCTFQSLSPAEKQRYQSRYRRRVRLDGQAYADRWLQEEACPTPAQKRKLSDGKAKNGRKCRAVSRPVTSMDGSMTVGIGRKCD
ncbi:MAG: hypothetical protein AB7E05_09970 [Sphingobium sp.]